MPNPMTDEPTDEPMLRWFDNAHLTADLREVSMAFAELAAYVVTELPRTPERTVALRKLLEAKDAAVRCALEARTLTRFVDQPVDQPVNQPVDQPGTKD